MRINVSKRPARIHRYPLSKNRLSLCGGHRTAGWERSSGMTPRIVMTSEGEKHVPAYGGGTAKISPRNRQRLKCSQSRTALSLSA